MQTLRFYTQRIFAVVCLIFFGFLLLIASKSSSIEAESNSREIWNRKQQEVPVREKFVKLPVLPPPQKEPLYAQPMQNPHGAQLDFQPQVGPKLDAVVPQYGELGIPRKINSELLDRIQHHIKTFDFKSLFTKECTTNTTLQEYWKLTQ
uniref:Uncharacterized protein n=1 Tax=Acrobeloides nanus TaxID=290746 RepID=A0A914D5F5_9BILA